MLADDLNGCLTKCLHAYLEDCLARRQSSQTVDEKRSMVGMFVKWCLSQSITNVAQIDRELLNRYLHYLHKYRKPIKQEPLNVSTIRNRLTAVKIFLERLYFFEIIHINLARWIELPVTPKRLPKGFLTVVEIERILSQTTLFGSKGIRDRAVMETYYATGVRRMELACLNTSDIDFEKAILTVNHGKGGHERRVPIADRACQWITVYLEQVRPKLANIESGVTLFLANDGLKYRPQQLTRLASKYVRRAGIKKPGACNLFRHSTATLMHENGADIRYVQEMLGHADISTTQVYTHVSINKLRQIYKMTHPASNYDKNTPNLSDFDWKN